MAVKENTLIIFLFCFEGVGGGGEKRTVYNRIQTVREEIKTIRIVFLQPYRH